jgi:hypothetical protein
MGESKFKEEERNTRFLGVGNPSESGAHLLYFFRQENKLSNTLFVYRDETIDRNSENIKLHYPNVKHYVFIDDFCGSGSQATNDKNTQCVTELKNLSDNITISYLMLFATDKGISVVRNSGLYDKVEAVVELDETFQCFSDKSRILPNNIHDYPFDKEFTKNFCYKYGRPLFYSIHQKEFSGIKLEEISDKTALGWGDCQLLLGFYHNTPNNTLPIIWYDEDAIDWYPIFRRYNKKYSI